MVLVAWVLFLFNIVMSTGIKGLIGIFLPARDKSASYPSDLEVEQAK
jgi:cytochrome c oxidase subunit 1